MQTFTKIIAVLTATVLFGSYSFAFAQTGPSVNGQRPPMGMGGPGMHGSFGSTTPHGPGRMGSSTDWSLPNGARAFPGVVTEVDSDHFLMTARPGADASTTVTVTVSSNTVFNRGGTEHPEMNQQSWTGSSTARMGGMPPKGMTGSTTRPEGRPMMGSSSPIATGSFSDVTVGSRVVVLGAFASSTKSIAAVRVIVNGGQGQSGEQNSKGDQSGGFLGKLKSFFSIFGGHSQASSTAGGPAAADASGGFLTSIWNSFASLFH